MWTHIKHYERSANTIQIQEAHNLICVDTAASDAENIYKWCLASLVDIFEKCCFKLFGTTLQDMFNCQIKFHLIRRP